MNTASVYTIQAHPWGGCSRPSGVQVAAGVRLDPSLFLVDREPLPRLQPSAPKGGKS